MQLGHVEILQETISLLETLWRLTPATHHHIHTDKCIRHHRLDLVDLVGKQLRVIMTVHQFQHRVTTALQRNMEMRHKRPTLCAIGNQLIRQQIGLQRTDPITADALHSIQCLHQIDELLTRRLAEIADVHTRQHDLLTPFRCRLFSLGHQRGDRRVTRESACIWDRTIGTEIVTAVLHLQEISRPVPP